MIMVYSHDFLVIRNHHFLDSHGLASSKRNQFSMVVGLTSRDDGPSKGWFGIAGFPAVS